MRKAMLQHFNDAAGFDNSNNNNNNNNNNKDKDNNVVYAPLASTSNSALAGDSSSSSNIKEEANKQVHRAEAMARIAAKHDFSAAAPAAASAEPVPSAFATTTSTDDGSAAVARPEVLVASDAAEQPCIVGPCAKPTADARLSAPRSGDAQDTAPEEHAAAASREAAGDGQAKEQARLRISAKHARESGGSGSSSSSVGSRLRAREAQRMLEQEVASSSSSQPLDIVARKPGRDRLAANPAQQIQGGSQQWGRAQSSSAKGLGLEQQGAQQGGRRSQVRAGGFGDLHLSMGGGHSEVATGGGRGGRGGGGGGGEGYAGSLGRARSLGMPQQLGMAMSGGGGGGGGGGVRSEGSYGGGAASSSGVYTGDSVQDHLFDIATKGSSARAYLSRRGGGATFSGTAQLGGAPASVAMASTATDDQTDRSSDPFNNHLFDLMRDCSVGGPACDGRE
jgi:hypothetical protein